MKLFWLKTRFTWIASLAEFENIPHTKTVKRVQTEMRKLCSHLLAIGGERVVVPFEDTAFCALFLELGEVISYKKLSRRNGEERDCHKNSGLLWLQNQTEYKIVTGFGLSSDNVWRRHSWILSADGRLIETTLARKIYFGIVLDNEGAKRFTMTYACD